jgi:hypothetical protein
MRGALQTLSLIQNASFRGTAAEAAKYFVLGFLHSFFD